MKVPGVDKGGGGNTIKIILEACQSKEIPRNCHFVTNNESDEV